MPLAFTQEDFLVVNANTLHTVLRRSFKFSDGRISALMYLRTISEENCDYFITVSLSSKQTK